METSRPVTKILAIVGTVLGWLPILATLFFAVAGSLASHTIRFDYLMPAELFPLALAGGGLLMVAALLAQARRAPIGASLALMLALLAGGQALAVVSGLASGEAPAVGLAWALVLGSIAGYILALLALDIEGLLLLRDLFGRHRQTGMPAIPAP